MRVAWVTPFNRRSAIGKVSSAVCKGLLARGLDVSIVRSECNPSTAGAQLDTNLSVYWWLGSEADDVLRNADAVVVNIGDNFEFHAGIFACLRQHLCIGIFHDFFLFNLFQGWLADRRGDANLHDRVISGHYGADVLPLARAAGKGEVELDRIADQLPMTEWISTQCGAAIAHSQFYRYRLDAVPGPVRVLPLSQAPRGIPPLEPRSGDDDVMVLTVGLVNPNKRADLVLRAIGSSDKLRERCRFRLAGPISDAQRQILEKVARENRVEKFDILGEVSDEELELELKRSDIICCLRSPVLEGASASAIEAMMAGRPVIVSDAGFYSELPSEYVIKVGPNVEAFQLATLLENLVHDEGERHRLGAQARKWSLETFTTQNYVSALVPFIQEFIACKPYLELGRTLGNHLAQLGLEPDDPAIERIDQTLEGLWKPVA